MIAGNVKQLGFSAFFTCNDPGKNTSYICAIILK
jgi:hypothetical protein